MQEFPDTYQHKGLRKRLVEEVQSKGIKDDRILQALGKIPRHLFMDSGFVKFSYQDKAFPIGAGQTISQPYTVAFQTELLEIKKGNKVLEVGTGSGYQTAVLIELGAKVYTIERQKELFVKTRSFLPKLGYNPHFFFGDGYEGKETYGPFEKILITAGADSIPEKLKKQLTIGGIMVIPVGNRQVQKMIKIKKLSEYEFEESTHGSFAFVPMLKGTQ